MRFAVTNMDKRVSPVFDVSRYIDLYNSEGYGHPAVFVATYSLPATLGEKISFLVECDIDTVICGALTREGELSLICHNIEVYAFIRGSMREVIQAWECASLSDERFFMPGLSHTHHHQGSDCPDGRKEKSDSF